MNRTELEKLLPEGTTVLGTEENARFIVRVSRKNQLRAGSLAESFRRFGVQALVVVADSDEIDLDRISLKLAGVSE